MKKSKSIISAGKGVRTGFLNFSSASLLKFVLKKAHIVSIFLILILLSCSTVPPAFPALYPVSFPTIEDVKPAWRQFTDGIDCFRGKISNPQLEFWALQIDLDAPDVRTVVSGGTAVESGFLSTKVSSFVRNSGLAAGINSVPFDVITSKEGQPIVNMGLVVSGGELLSPANPHYDALVIYKNRRAAVVSQRDVKTIEDIENAAGGFYKILNGGEQTQRTSANAERHPRSAAGVSANGSILYLLVIDGRRTGSIGATENETAFLVRVLGSYNGINFDGGGSSALALRRADGTVKIVNTAIHDGIPGRERAVAGCLGIAVNLSTER